MHDMTNRWYAVHAYSNFENKVADSIRSTTQAPWYIVPADDKENARLIVSAIVLEAFEQFRMHYPKANAKRRRELLAIRRKLLK
jgi:polyphosphate kinase 2 (PPK2 family)